MSSVHFSSESEEWETPQELFDKLDKVYNFNLDVCATPQNAKVNRFFTKEDDGLTKKWQGNCWMNPPYGRSISKWVEKAYIEAMNGAVVVALLPARTDTKWFHSFIYNKMNVSFLKGRLKFSKHNNSAPFPSMIVEFKKAI